MFKRFTSMLLALIMVLGVFPVSAMAADEQQTVAVTNEILHEQIKINTHQLAVNIGTSTEGILVVNVPASITDTDLENAYVGDPLNCTFVDFSVSVPEPLKNETEIKFYEFFGSDVSNMENINVPENEWYTFIDGSYMPGWLITLATKDEEGNIVREAEGETWFDYGIAWSVGGEVYYQTLRIVREMPVTPGVFEGRTTAMGSNLEYFETIYSGSKVTYRYKGEKTTAEEIATEFGANANGSMGITTLLEIPEGYTGVDEFFEDDTEVTEDWLSFSSEFTDVEEGNIVLLPVGYTQGTDIIEGERTFTIVWTDGNGGTSEETITVATDFGDIVEDENGGNGGEEDIPAGDRDFVERARLVLGDCEEFFRKGRNGVDIIYTYNVEEDDTREKVLERILANNKNNPGFDVKLDSPNTGIYTTVEEIRIGDMDVTSDFINPGERVTSLNLGRIWFTTMVGNLCEARTPRYTVIWSNGKTGTERQTYMESGITFSVKFPVLENYDWMSTYNNPLASGRIDVVNSEGTKIAVGGEAVDGLSVKGYENGKLSIEYAKPADGSEETFSVSVKAPDGAACYRVLTGKEAIGYNPDKEGEYDSVLDWEVESIPLGANGKFDVEIELGKIGQIHKYVDGINVWYNDDSAEDLEKQVAVIKWYDEGGTIDDDLYLNEYFYIDLEYKEIKTPVSGVDEVTEKVTAPIVEGGSKAEIVFGETEQNISPVNTETSGRYYFVLETEDSLVEGEKVYIPYSFISEGMNAQKAANLDISIKNLAGETAGTSAIKCDEFGMFFYTDKLGEFVLSWDKKISGDEDRRFPETFYEYWREGEIVTTDQLSLSAHPAIVDYMSFEYVDEVLVVTVEDIPVEVWKEVYDSLDPGELLINAEIHIAPPYNDIGLVNYENGNGYAYQILKNKLNSGAEIGFHEDSYARGFEAVAQIESKEDEITIIPRDSGIFFTTVAWKNSSGDIITQILPYEFKRAEDAKSVSFPNEKTVFSGEVRTDERSRTENPIIVADYNKEKGVLKYTYNGPRYPGNPNEDIIIGESIAINEYGEENWAIDTIVKAPEGYERADGKGSYYLFSIWFGDQRPLFGSSNIFDAKWKNSTTGEIRVETITIQFDPGKVWMEKHWDGITKEDVDRVVFVPINDPEGEVRYETVESLKEYGINIDLFSKPGCIYSDFGDINKIDIQTIANLEVMILPPDATPKNEGESTEDWIDRVYRETEYKFNKEGATGVDWYDPAYADYANKSIDSHPFRAVGRNSFRENVAAFEYIEVNGITAWFTFSDGGNGHTVYVDWYKADENGNPEAEPSVREYVYAQWEQLVFEETAEAVTEGTIVEIGSVDVATPVVKEGEKKWKLTTNHYPQTKKNEDVSAYYFQLEGDENTPEGKKVVYLPYSFIDEDLDYDKAREMKLKPKIHHYNKDHSELVEGKPIDGELRPEGIRFEVESFSPFVLEWSVHSFGETTYKWSEDWKTCTAERVCLECEDHIETETVNAFEKQISAPTCTEKGKTEYTATFDADWAETKTKTVANIPETGHDWGEWVVTKNATYFEKGTRERVCENKCGEKEIEFLSELIIDEEIDVVVPGADPDDEHRIAVRDEVKAPENIPEEYKNKYSTAEKIENELEKAIYSENEKFSSKNSEIEFMEITLEIKTKDGWVEVTKENFPKEGIEICIPYPIGSGRFDRFEVAHLRDDGIIEVLDYRKTRNGLVVKVYSLSPFAVAYIETENVFDSFGETEDGITITIQGEKTEDETNPNTGAAVFVPNTAVSLFGAVGLFLLGKKHR